MKSAQPKETSSTTADSPVLPPGWQTRLLGQVCEINPRRPPLQRPDDAPTTFIPMPAVAEFGAGITSPEIRPYASVRKGYTYFAEGDVLFAKITPCMQNGKHAIAHDLADGVGFGSTEFHVLRPHQDTTAPWLHLFLLQPRILQDAAANLTGAVGQQRIPPEYLASLTIPLPPLPDQRRITTALQAQLAAVAQARSALHAQLNATRTLTAAHLRTAFNSEVTRSWPRIPIGEMAELQSGYAFKSDWFVPNGIRLLRNANVSQDRLDWTDTVFLPTARKEEFPTYDLREGDIVLSLDRPVVSGGLKVARVTTSDLPALLLQRVGRFRPSAALDTNYLFHFLHTQDFIGEITAHDQSLGVPHVSPKQVERVRIPMPPLADQRAIAARIDTTLAETRALAAHQSARITTLDFLPTALFREAFSGQI